MSKCLVLFVEGDTEVEFYKQVIANARKLRPNGMFDTSIECKSINGVGGFKNIVLRKFVKEIKTKYDDDCVFTVVLCRDSDAIILDKCASWINLNTRIIGEMNEAYPHIDFSILANY